MLSEGLKRRESRLQVLNKKKTFIYFRYLEENTQRRILKKRKPLKCLLRIQDLYKSFSNLENLLEVLQVLGEFLI